MTLKVCLRPSRETDAHFVASRASNDLYRGIVKLCPRPMFRRHVYTNMLRLLGSNTQILIATRADDPEDRIGYIVYSRIGDKLIVHYVWVHTPWRRQGLGSFLLQQIGITNLYMPIYTSNITTIAYKINKQHRKTGKYNILYLPDLSEEIINLYKENER